jgi:hypothetical protein
MCNFLPQFMDIDSSPLSPMSPLRCLWGQDHGSCNGTQYRGNDVARDATAVAKPSDFQRTACSAQMSTHEEFRSLPWFGKVRTRQQHPVKVYLTHNLV